MPAITLSQSEFAPRLVAEGQTDSRRVVAQVSPVKPLVRWIFFAFVFSLLFEEAPISIPVEVTEITGGLLVMAALLLQPRRCFGHIPAALWCYGVYLWIGLLILAYYHSLFDPDAIFRLVKLLQLLIIFWITYNLMREEAVARGGLLSLGASCTLLSFLNIFGLTTTTDSAVSKLDRFTAYGLDSNQLGGMLALGVLALLGLAYGLQNKWFIRPRFLVWAAIVPMAVTIMETGSRGALLALGAGMMVFMLRKGTLASKLRNVFVTLLAIVFFGLVAYQSEMVRHRFEVTVEEGGMSEREQIFPMAWQMIVERPFIGWGPLLNTYELGNRLGLYGHDRIDAHNLILYVLTATGIIGAIPFFVGLGICLWAAWKARSGAHGVVPLALAACLMTADMSVSGLHWKQHWLVLAYALAAGTQFVTGPLGARRRPSVRAQRLNLLGNQKQSFASIGISRTAEQARL